MSKGNGCFYCKHCINNRLDQRPGQVGWMHDCAKGLDNSKIETKEDMLACPQAEPRVGFQIGGYYSFMELVGPNFSGGEGHDGCLEWLIYSDGDFPRDTPEMSFHLCSWQQIKDWVAFWDKVIQKRIAENKSRNETIRDMNKQQS